MGLCFPDCSFAVKAEKLPLIEGFVAAATSSEARVELIEGWDGLHGSGFGGRQLCRWAIYAGSGFFSLTGAGVDPWEAGGYSCAG